MNYEDAIEIRDAILAASELLSKAIVGGINLERPTIRDYFAAHAPIFLSDIPLTAYAGEGTERDLTTRERIDRLSKLRWRYADSMIHDREVK